MSHAYFTEHFIDVTENLPQKYNDNIENLNLYPTDQKQTNFTNWKTQTAENQKHQKLNKQRA
jgi:hypothetical protein